jgi:hypothetical protein
MLPGKDDTLAKVSHDLVILHQEYESHHQSGSRDPFTPSNPLVRVIDGQVVIDAVAAGDANALRTDLEILGLQQAASFGLMVSGRLPISAIHAMAALDSLQFARPAYVATGGGGGVVTGSGPVIGPGAVKITVETDSTVSPDEAGKK